MLNHAKAVRGIVSHQVEGVRVPQVVRNDQPDVDATRARRDHGACAPQVRAGAARVEWEVALEKKNRGLRALPLHFIALLFNRAARFTCRETLAVFAWNIRVLRGYSVLLTTSKIANLVTKLVNPNLLERAAENTKAAEVAANQVLDLKGPTGREPADRPEG